VSTVGKGPSFWTTLPGILTAVAALITAVTGLLVALGQAGLLGGGTTNDNPDAAASTSSESPPAASVTTVQGEGDALAGTWQGRAAQADGRKPFDVRLEVAAPCVLKKPCGVIAVSAAPCSGRATLWTVNSTTYEFYIDEFTAGSSPDCTSGAGDFFHLLDDGTLEYTTDYSDVSGLLQQVD
jgi:hypothetical protein